MGKLIKKNLRSECSNKSYFRQNTESKTKSKSESLFSGKSFEFMNINKKLTIIFPLGGRAKP